MLLIKLSSTWNKKLIQAINKEFRPVKLNQFLNKNDINKNERVSQNKSESERN